MNRGAIIGSLFHGHKKRPPFQTASRSIFCLKQLELEACAELDLENLAARRYVVIDSDLPKIRLGWTLLKNLKEVRIRDPAHTAQLRRNIAVLSDKARRRRRIRLREKQIRFIQDVEKFRGEDEPFSFIEIKALLDAEIDVVHITISEVVPGQFHTRNQHWTIVVDTVAVEVRTDRRIDRRSGTEPDRARNFKSVRQEEYRIRDELMCSIKSRRPVLSPE